MNPSTFTPRIRPAFTLVELLTVIAVVAILGVILIAMIPKIRSMSNTTECASNLRQMFQIANLWSLDNDGWVPQAMWYSTQRNADPNMLNYGLTEELMLCPSTDLPRSYGISVKLVAGGESMWGKGDVQYWKHGRYRFAELNPTETILFADTISTSSGYYMAGDRWVDYRHGDEAQVVFTDGHIERLGQDKLADNNTWLEGILYP